MKANEFSFDELSCFDGSRYGTAHGLDDEFGVALFEVAMRISQISIAWLIAGGNAHFVFILRLFLLREDSSVFFHRSNEVGFKYYKF